MKKQTIYLAGGMENRKDGGHKWRSMITPKLNELGFNVYNPCLEEEEILEKNNFESSKDIQEISKAYHIEQLKSFGRDIIKKDLDALRKCDLMIVYYDESVNMGSGTISEMTVAQYMNMFEGKKMWVGVIKKVSFASIPTWTIGCIDEWFDTIDSLIQNLKEKK